MTKGTKTILEINKKAVEGRVAVLTEYEFLEKLRTGEEPTLSDLDVVVMAFPGDFAGTAAMLLVPVAQRGKFTRAKSIRLNGVPGYPGPAPNERLGVVDTLVFAEQRSREPQAGYTGVDLFIDLLEDRPVEVECVSVEGGSYYNSFRLGELTFARFYCFNIFLPPDRQTSNNSISHNNSHLETIQMGTKVLLNGVPSVVVGCGTRNLPGRKSVSLAADMFEMRTATLQPSESEKHTLAVHSVAIALPMLNDKILQAVQGYLKEAPWQEGPCSHMVTDKNAAINLKELVSNGKFMLTESARPLWTGT